MPEFYVEPMKDRRSCFVCKKTVKGKKVLLTCIKCHAITYCGRECQSADWGRHEWNCVPVMVKEFPGKGRGLVAARDIVKGEIIFKDKPVIKLAVNAKGRIVNPDFMASLKDQIDSLPSEARGQYYKLTTSDDTNSYNLSRSSDIEVLNLFLSHSKIYMSGGKYLLLHLNIALVNHSCAPNASSGSRKPKDQEDGQERSMELRAIKNIGKGEEITICEFRDVKKFGSIPRKRKTAIKRNLGFDCKCPVCLGQVPGQEKTVKKLIELHSKLNPTPSDWRREAGIWSRIVDVTMELHIGDPREKVMALDALLRFAHLARDKDLRRKAMDMWRQCAEDTKLEAIQMNYEEIEMDLVQWSTEFSTNTGPKKKEITSILRLIQEEFYHSV